MYGWYLVSIYLLTCDVWCYLCEGGGGVQLVWCKNIFIYSFILYSLLYIIVHGAPSTSSKPKTVLPGQFHECLGWSHASFGFQWLNPSSPVDANMCPIIACMKGPIYVKIVVHTLTDLSVATRGQCLRACQSSLCSPLSIFWLLKHLSWPLSKQEIKHKTCTKLWLSCSANRELQKKQQVG